MMSLRTLLFGTAKTDRTAADTAYEKVDERLKELAAKRERMRQQLGDALRQVIEENKS